MFFYVTQAPKYFTNGYSLKKPGNEIAENKYQFEDLSAFKHQLTSRVTSNENLLIPYRSLSNEKFANGYSSEEIVSFLNYKIKNGGL